MFFNQLSQNHCRLKIRFKQFRHEYYNSVQQTVAFKVKNTEPLIIQFGGGEWEILPDVNANRKRNGAWDVVVRIKLLRGNVQACNVALEFSFGNWNTQNYVLLPAAAYNGNRFESRRIAYSPKLYDPRDIGPDKEMIISDIPRLNVHDGPSVLYDRSGSMTVPSAGFFAPVSQTGFAMFSAQKNKLGDLGFYVQENSNRDRAVFGLASPLVRELYQYKITDHQYPSHDIPNNWNVGDEIALEVTTNFFQCEHVNDLFAHWANVKFEDDLHYDPNLMLPFSSAFAIQEEKYNRDNWVDEHGYYSVGMREMFLQDWQIGWTGGMIATYPLMMEGSQETVDRVLRNFQWLFDGGIAPSGFFWDSGEKGTKWYGGDIRKFHTQNWHLTRKSADGLYFILQQFFLMKQKGINIPDEWNDKLQGVANAFVKLWDENAQFGQFIDNRSGEIIVGGSSSAAIAPAALCLAHQYFHDRVFLRIAVESGKYFHENFTLRGITCGGVGDALQNPDSESAYALIESYCSLFENTGDNYWLTAAEQAANQFATWVMDYDYVFPESSTHGKMGMKTRGTVFANTQNKHAAPGICTHSGFALLRLFRYTKKRFYLDLLQIIAQAIPQYLSVKSRLVPGLKEGWMSERINTTDWLEGIGETMKGSTWAEISLMLTYIQVPGIYAVPGLDLFMCFDQLEVKGGKNELGEMVLNIKNLTQTKADARIWIEHVDQLSKPLTGNYLSKCRIVEVNPGEQREFIITDAS